MVKFEFVLMLLLMLWSEGRLGLEINIQVSLKGLPAPVTSALSLPNPRKPDGYDYFLFAGREHNDSFLSPDDFLSLSETLATNLRPIFLNKCQCLVSPPLSLSSVLQHQDLR